MKPYLLLPFILFLITGTKLYHDPEDKILNKARSKLAEFDNCLNNDQYLNDANSYQSDFVTRYLIVDHLFTYTNPTVNYEISVQGKIEIQSRNAGIVYVWYPDKEVMAIVCELFGEGTVTESGRGSMNLGQFKVKKINYDSSMKVNLNGKTRFVKMPEAGGSRPIVNISLDEKWDGDFIWDIETSDPENDNIRYDMLKQIVPRKIPDSPHTGKTLEYYNETFLGNSTFESTTSIAGMGTFHWSYTFTEGEVTGSDKYRVNVNPKGSQLNYDDSRPKPKDYVFYPEAKLGPPLESIEWDLADPNGPVTRNSK